MENLRNAIGIDVSSEKFDVCLSSITSEGKIKVIASGGFTNTKEGFKKLIKWVKAVNKNKELPLLYIMEATGVYHEELAYFLNEKKFTVAIVLPSKAKKYMQSLPMKTKTDKVDARNLAQLGLEREHTPWVPPIEIYKRLRGLSRERELKIVKRTEAKNQLTAIKRSYDKNPHTIKRCKDEIEFLNKQIKQIEKEMSQIVESEQELKEKVEKLETIKGVGITTILTIISETFGFSMIENGKQLVSYSGLDVVQNSSGKQNGTTRISKKGNVHIRSGLYMCALSVMRYNRHIGGLYKRILKKGKSCKVGIIAVARKTLLLIYTLWKNNSEFDPNYGLEINQ